jgi:hypothetical protein
MAVLLGALLRFYRIEKVGLAGNDTIYYTNIAKAWSGGEMVYQAVASQTFVYRPVVFSIFGAAVRLFGYTDYAIKIVNAIIDLINISLIFAICFILVRKDPWPAFAAALIYACSPVAIQMSRVEMTHVISTMMILSALFFFLIHERSLGVWRSRFYLVLSAVFTGFAVLSHEDLVLTAVGYALFLGLVFLRSSRARADLETLVMNFTLFSGFLFFVGGSAFIFHQNFVVSRFMPRGSAKAFVETPSYLEQLAKLFWNGVLSHGSAFLLMVCVPLLAFALFKGVFSKMEKDLFSSCLPWILLICYGAGYVKLLSFFRPRIFFPFFSVVIILVVVWCTHLMAQSRLPAVGCRRVVLSLALLAIFFNLGNYQNRALYENASLENWLPISIALPPNPMAGYQEVKSKIYRTGWARDIYDKLTGKVSESSRLLVTSSIFQPYPGRRVFQVGYYFGDNAVYLFDHTEPLDELITKYKIKYVLFTTRLPHRQFLNKERFARYLYNGGWELWDQRTLGASYGFAPGQYTVKKEWKFLSTYLESHSAELLYSHGWTEKKRRKPFARRTLDFIYEL